MVIAGVIFVVSSPLLPLSQISKGNLIVIGDSDRYGRALYLFHPFLGYWQPISPRNISVSSMAASPDGKRVAYIFDTGTTAGGRSGIAVVTLATLETQIVYYAPLTDRLNRVAWYSMK